MWGPDVRSPLPAVLSATAALAVGAACGPAAPGPGASGAPASGESGQASATSGQRVDGDAAARIAVEPRRVALEERGLDVSGADAIAASAEGWVVVRRHASPPLLTRFVGGAWRPARPLSVPDAPSSWVAVAVRGAWVAAVTGDGALYGWRLEDEPGPALRLAQGGALAEVEVLSLSGDGSLAALSGAGGARLVSLPAVGEATAARSGAPRALPAGTRRAWLSPDPARIAVSDAAGLWVGTAVGDAPLSAAGASADDLAFDARGRRAVVAGVDGVVRALWLDDSAGAARAATAPRAHGGRLRRVAVLDDGRSALTLGGEPPELLFWRLDEAGLVEPESVAGIGAIGDFAVVGATLVTLADGALRAASLEPLL